MYSNHLGIIQQMHQSHAEKHLCFMKSFVVMEHTDIRLFHHHYQNIGIFFNITIFIAIYWPGAQGGRVATLLLGYAEFD